MNTFGNLFRVTTWGESHGPAVGAVVDGCPARLPLELADIQVELDRRRPGQSDIVTPRKEEDRVEILSGLFEGRTAGTPISMLVRNADQRPGAYDEMRDKFRPSHADFTYQQKYGSPEIDPQPVVIASATLLPDGSSVRLRCTGLRERYVHELHVEGVRSHAGEAVVNPVGYYTLNRLPAPRP